MTDDLIPTAVVRIRNFLRRTYDGFIDMSDVPKSAKSDTRDQIFLSRALAALAVADSLGLPPDKAAASVIDGDKDWGIDSLGVDERGKVPHLLLNQSKWSDKAKGRFGHDEVDALKRGVGYIHNGRIDKFTARMHPHAERVSEVIATAGAQVVMMVSVMRRRSNNPLASSVVELLEELRDEIGGVLRILYLEDIEAMYERAWSGSNVNVDSHLDSFFQVTGPQEAYSGAVSADKLAGWYDQFDTKLFDDNVRLPLGRTSVNTGIVKSLIEAPTEFFYRNNGVAVLCDKVEFAPGARVKGSGVVGLKGVRVVNGAQTIASIAQARQSNPEQVAGATVGIKIICLEGSEDGFESTVTRAMNTQNAMVLQDYVAIDDKQQRLAMDFRDHLGKEYVLQRGSTLPRSEDVGCRVEEAAEALACADRDAGITARVRKDPDALWDTEANGLYPRLFGGTLKAETVWRQVELLRTVRAWLTGERERRSGKAALITEHAALLCAHVIFQQMREHWQLTALSEADWKKVLSNAEEMMSRVLDLLISRHQERYSMPVATLKNPERCRELAAHVIADLNGTEPVVLRKADQPKKRATSAVAVLHQSGRIPDGTRLELRGVSSQERRVLDPWLDKDSRHGHVTWVARGGARCLRWEWDGERYSASGLIERIMNLAHGDDIERSLQGTLYWHLPGEGNLVQLADEVRRAEAEDEEE